MLYPSQIRLLIIHKLHWHLDWVCQVRDAIAQEKLAHSGALWQGSNSKIENYGFLAAVALFEKVIFNHFWHVDAISHCADNDLVFLQKIFVSCQYACANGIFEKTENGKV